MKNNSRKSLIRIALSLLAIFLFFFFIGTIQETLEFEIKKVNLPSFINLTTVEPLAISTSIHHQGISDSVDSVVNERPKSDSITQERVLLLGDSQLEGLRKPMHEYCGANNHELVSTVLWYGSTTKQWSNTDTMNYFIRKYNPTIVIFAIGLNELFVNDLDNRKKYIENILGKIKNFDVNFFWIGPAAWTKDKGVIKIMQELVGKDFYPSHLLTLARASDNRHPSRGAARIWADSVAVFMTEKRKINFSKKASIGSKFKKTPLILLAPPK